MSVGRLSPSQILRRARALGIENDCNWTLDAGVREDDTPMWQGSATLTLGVLRLLAYNLLQLARRKHLRPPSPKPGRSGPQRSWREVPARLRASADTVLKEGLGSRR